MIRPCPPFFVGHRLRFAPQRVIEGANRLGHSSTNEYTINPAITSGILNDGQLSFFPYAARFWAAIRRHQLDAHFDPEALAPLHGLSAANLFPYLSSS